MRRPRHPHTAKRERTLDRLAELVATLPPERVEAFERDVLEVELDQEAPTGRQEDAR